RAPEAKAKGLDLAQDECDALIAYVKALPRPVEAASPGDDVAEGKALFASVGCATCHTPKLGDVEGIYADLLLHDLGPELGDPGQYGVSVPDSSEPDFVDPDHPITDATPPAPAQPGEAVVVTAPAATTTVTTPIEVQVREVREAPVPSQVAFA